MKNIAKVVLVLVQLSYISSAQGSELMSEVTKEIERINLMREGLVSGVQGEVSPKVFKAVCMPVGKELKKISKSLGVKVKQTSMKYRNINHKPSKFEKSILKDLEQNKDLVSLWKKSELGMHYFRRINTQKACLNCHGSRHLRPGFIKKKYPRDRAFGFRVGELRGVYSVFIPNKGSLEPLK